MVVRVLLTFFQGSSDPSTHSTIKTTLFTSTSMPLKVGVLIHIVVSPNCSHGLFWTLDNCLRSFLSRVWFSTWHWHFIPVFYRAWIHPFAWGTNGIRVYQVSHYMLTWRRKYLTLIMEVHELEWRNFIVRPVEAHGNVWSLAWYQLEDACKYVI